MKVGAVVILRLTDLNGSLDGGLLDAPKVVTYTSTKINTIITFGLEVLHLLVDLLVSGNVRLRVISLILPFLLEGSELFFKLSGASLCETGPKEHEL